jgi:hypothetical protein
MLGAPSLFTARNPSHLWAGGIKSAWPGSLTHNIIIVCIAHIFKKTKIFYEKTAKSRSGF